MIVFGKNVANEILDSGKSINEVYLSKTFDDKNIKNKLDRLKVKVNMMDKKAIDRKFKGNHQGIVLDIEDYKYKKLEDIFNKNFIVILDHLEDPHNLGAIIRTSVAAGVDAIVIPKRRGVEINSTVMKVSAGALNKIDIVEENSLAQAIEVLKKHGFWVYGTDMRDSVNYTDVEYDNKTCLVIGSEGNGISKLVRDKCDFIISIPMKGKLDSLNASVAAGIVIYEVVRQRGIGE